MIRKSLVIVLCFLSVSILADNLFGKVLRRLKKGHRAGALDQEDLAQDIGQCVDPHLLIQTRSLLKQTEAEKSDLSQEKQRLVKELQDVQRKLDTTTRESNKRYEELKTLTQKHGDDTKDIRRLKQQVEQLRNELKAVSQNSSQRYGSTGSESKKLQNELERERNRIARLQESKNVLESDKKNLESVVKKLQARLKSISSDLDGEFEARLEEEVARVRAEVEQEWKDDYQSLQEESILDLEQAQQQWQTRLQDSTNSALAEIQKLVLEHENHVLELDQKCKSTQDELQAKLDDTDSVISQLEREHTAARQSYATMESEMKTARQEMVFWKGLFENRSIFNATLVTQRTGHVLGDVHTVIRAALGRKLDAALKELSARFTSAAKTHIDSIATVTGVQNKIDVAKLAMKDAYEAIVATLAGKYETVLCPKLLSWLETTKASGAEDERNEAIAALVARVTVSCQEGQHVIETGFFVVACVLALFLGVSALRFAASVSLFLPRKMVESIKGKKSGESTKSKFTYKNVGLRGNGKVKQT